MQKNKITLFQMLLLVRFSQYDGAQFQILLYIVTYLYRKTHETIYRMTQNSLCLLMNNICRWLNLQPREKGRDQRHKIYKDYVKAVI